MSRYIDAELFAKNLSLLVYMADDEDFTKAFVKGMQLVKEAEDMTPTADVAPIADTVQKVGEWLREQNKALGGAYHRLIYNFDTQIAKELTEGK